MKQLEAAVIGSTGYGGEELTDILERHPHVSHLHTPQREELETFEGSDTVFLALPHGVAAPWAARFHKLGSKVIDLSSDFRLPTAAAYKAAYDKDHPAPELLSVARYGLPERYRESLRDASLVAMPGCFPTVSILGIMPLVDGGLVRPDRRIIIDADTAVSGAGKTPTEKTHYMNVANNAVSYHSGRKHRHVREIEHYLGGRAIFFSPTVIPAERGILAKISMELSETTDEEGIRAAFAAAYAHEPFVEVTTQAELPDLQETARSDECHIGIVVDGEMVQVGGSIDNLRKGAASQAVQIFNIMHGLPEAAGLTPKAGWQAAAA